ncbi:MAG: glycerophosphodiester phosphodiesterase [Desulfobacteraceae bacterium]|nr:glycerophosphodiester phosphodiesterase [Desulfobacteraceae bacterium]
MALNIAHRGGRSLGPENTLSAARKGLNAGADLWETDVVVTADEKLILFHDDSLIRTTDAETCFPDRSPWTFTTFTLDEIRSLDAGSWFGKTDPFGLVGAGEVSKDDLSAFQGEKVPTLEETLIFTQEADWQINLELKKLPPPMTHFPLVERVLALIDRIKADTHRIIVSSFNHDWLREVQTRNPDIAVQALVGFPGTYLNWGDFEFKTYNANSTMADEEEIRSVTRKDVTVNLFTVNEEDDMRRFIAAGASGIITDFPQKMEKLK